MAIIARPKNRIFRHAVIVIAIKLLFMKKDLRLAVAHLDAPFAVLDLDAAKANAENMAHRSRGTPIRVASKSLRIRSLISEVLLSLIHI